MSSLHHNHPEADERQALNVQRSTFNVQRSTSASAPAARPIDPELLAELAEHKNASGLKNKALGKGLGFSESQVGRAFAGKFSGDVERFETNARDFLRKEEEKRQRPAVKLQSEGFVVQPMAEFLSHVAAAGDIGVAFSPAGRGKTLGTLVWLESNPLAVMVTACKEVAGWRSIRDAIVEALPYSVRPRKRESKAAFIQRVFCNSGRLLIVDNAHLLTPSARYWLAYDWHGKTKCPVALIGNEVIRSQWGHREGREDANDQLSSRVGVAYEITPAADVPARVSVLLAMELLFPAATSDEEAVELGVKVIRSKGHARALEKHLNLARVLSEEKREAPATAMRRANRLLLGEKLAA
jgi:DNA transposition AAA+ family ATPase